MYKKYFLTFHIKPFCGSHARSATAKRSLGSSSPAPGFRLRAASFKGLRPPCIVAVSTKEEFVYFQFVSAGAVPVGGARDAITPSLFPLSTGG